MPSIESRVVVPRPGLVDAPPSMQETACPLTSKTSNETCPGGGRAIDGRSRGLVPLLRVRAALAGLGLALAANGAQAADEIRIALLPTVVHSSESPDYLRAGLADMIASRLERVQEFDVLRIDDPATATTNLESALATARESEADFVLFGSFTRFGTGASLDVQCASVRVESGHKPLREIFVHSGSIGDVIPDLDDLVGKVARFVITDYEERALNSNGLPELPSMRALIDLQRRVEALEEALRASSPVDSTADEDAALPEELRIGEAGIGADASGGLE